MAAAFAVDDLVAALKRVSANGGAVVHLGEVWAICRDSEGSPFALAQNARGAPDPLPTAMGRLWAAPAARPVPGI